MSKLKMKARAGVTLVELLVVMLIAVILAISLLPMFKEYICKAQYNAEAVPVIATLRTKISLYQYERSKLPANSESDDYVSSWEFDQTDKEKFVIAQYKLGEAPTCTEDGDKLTDTGKTRKNDIDLSGDDKDKPIHLGHASILDIDYQDLKGRRSRPIDYVYYKIPCEKPTDSAYIIGCFGAGHGGLAEGTGYAVCEINLVSCGKKYIGTFERYKAKEKEGDCPYLYLDKKTDPVDVNGDFVYCPEKIEDATQETGVPEIINDMRLRGWQFSDD